MSKATPSASRSLVIALGALSSASRVRQTDVFERVAGSAARWSAHGVRRTHPSMTAALASARARSTSRPPMSRAHSRATIQSSTQSIEGVLIVSPSKIPRIREPPLVMRKILGRGQGGA